MSSAPGLPSQSVASLVRGLDDLHGGPEVQLVLIAKGQEAVGPLAEFLLGPPALHPQPRMLAAEALGAIGGAAASRVLASALTTGDLASLPAVYRLSEEAVRNRVAQELGRLGDRAAVEPLLEALARFHLVQAGAALLGFREPRAVGLIVECLDDDFIRERAAAILLQFGRDAIDALIAGLGRPERRGDDETPRSVARRAACARLLGEIGDGRGEGPLLAGLFERQASIRVAAAVALTRLRPERAGAELVSRLIEGLHAEDPSVVDECAAALVSVGAAAVPSLAAAFMREAAREETRGEPRPGPAVRAMARTLGRMDEAGAEVLAALVDHPRSFVRALAIANLGTADPAWAAPVIAPALRDPDPRVRRTAAARLEQLGVRRHA